MKVLIVEPGQYPREADIEPTLEAKQKIVGGLIDVAYPFPDDNVCVVLNDEGKLCGEVRFAEAEPVVDAITPVPGGVGTVTTSVLVSHVVEAAEKTV